MARLLAFTLNGRPRTDAVPDNVLLLDFLRHYDADLIYLVGDIVDGWQLKSGWYWPQAHNDVVQKLLRKARKGARIIYHSVE